MKQTGLAASFCCRFSRYKSYIRKKYLQRVENLPASISSTFHWGTSDRRAAATAPAEPPPITTKSYS